MKAIKKYRKLVNELVEFINLWSQDEKYFSDLKTYDLSNIAYYRIRVYSKILQEVLNCNFSFKEEKVSFLKMPFHFNASSVSKNFGELRNEINSCSDDLRRIMLPILERYLEPLQKLESF